MFFVSANQTRNSMDSKFSRKKYIAWFGWVTAETLESNFQPEHI